MSKRTENPIKKPCLSFAHLDEQNEYAILFDARPRSPIALRERMLGTVRRSIGAVCEGSVHRGPAAVMARSYGEPRTNRYPVLLVRMVTTVNQYGVVYRITG